MYIIGYDKTAASTFPLPLIRIIVSANEIHRLLNRNRNRNRKIATKEKREGTSEINVIRETSQEGGRRI